MAKSDKEVVWDILRAQGISAEPTPEAIKVFANARAHSYLEGVRDTNADNDFSPEIFD
jgi:hypothetical protein